MRRRIVMMFALLLPLSCSDTTGPCSTCGARPADLDIASITMLTAGSTPHPVTGKPVVDSVRVRYVIRNAGDSASVPTALYVNSGNHFHYDTIPGLAGGDSVVRIVVFPREQMYNFASNPRGIHTAHIAMNEEYRSSPDSVHLPLPVLEVTLSPPREPHLRANDPLDLTVSIRNHSPIAAARNIQMRHCLWDYDVGCWSPNWTAFGNVALPDIAAGETRTITYTTAITPTAMEEGFLYYSLSGCVTSRSDTAAYRPYQLDDSWVCDSAGQIEVWPDFEACAPPLLGAQPITLNAPNCGIYPAAPNATVNELRSLQFKLYYVFVLDAQAGQTYQINGFSFPFDVRTTLGRRAIDLEPAADRVRFSEAGRYYVTYHTWTGPFTISAVPVP